MNNDLLLILGPAAVIFLLFMGVYKLMLEKKVKAQENIHELLGTPQNPGSPLARQRDDFILKRRSKDERSLTYQLETNLDRANLLLRPNEFILISLGVGVLTGLVVYLAVERNLILAIVGMLGGLFLPQIYLMLRIMLRMKKAQEQFADVLDTMVNCFKSGYGFTRAVQSISESYDDPWGTEFGKMTAEMNLGSSQEDILINLAKRIPNNDVDLFVTALIIQKETGGNMAELLSNLSKTIRERYKLFRKISAISAQGKLSATTVSCIPFLLIGIMFAFLPDETIAFVTHPIGIILMALAGIWMSIGIGVLYKIVQIEV